VDNAAGVNQFIRIDTSQLVTKRQHIKEFRNRGKLKPYICDFDKIAALTTSESKSKP